MQEKCVFLCVFVYFLAMVDRRNTKEAPPIHWKGRVGNTTCRESFVDTSSVVTDYLAVYRFVLE